MKRSSWTVWKKRYDMSWLLYQDIVQVPNVQMLNNVIKHQNISPSHPTLNKKKKKKYLEADKATSKASTFN